AAGDMTEQAPVLYQQNSDGSRQPVSGRYVLEGNNQVGFAVGAYDPGRTLTIDPVLVYSTYLGGSFPASGTFGSSDAGNAIAVDKAGHAYRAGETTAVHFPGTAGVYQSFNSGNYQAFVTKLSPDGKLVYSTYLGGSGDPGFGTNGSNDAGWGIAVD